jgi:glycerol-3-phosphate dehydrogenase (NAD(P)+)
VSGPGRERTIAVFGAGSWGTALAILLARNGFRTLLWGRNEAKMARMRDERCNPFYLPDAPFPDLLEPTSDLHGALAQADRLLVVVPSEAFRSFMRDLAPHLHPGIRLIWATKGLETETGKFLHEIVREEIGLAVPCGVISGPSFAKEVAAGLPTAVTVASTNRDLLDEAISWFHSDTFRVYMSEDLPGVELGGALKNVLAIAAGISDGLGFGANARAAIITRGLAEIMRLGDKAGAQRETLMGLSGLGDLVLTCTDDQSRNRRLGLALGSGKDFQVAVDEIGQVVEGAKSARVALRKADELDVEMPICQQVHRILYEGHPPRRAVAELLGRDLKPEMA